MGLFANPIWLNYNKNSTLFLYKFFELKKVFYFLISVSILFFSCTAPVGVFEKNIPIPKQQWESSFRPEIVFNVKDTVSSYNIYIVVRHSDAYNFNNMWVNATVQQPGDSARSQRFNLLLATNEKGWMGSAMDDIYEQRVLIQPQTKFLKPGDYHFTLEQVMREDPLLHVLSMGIRVEKANH